MPGTTKSFLMLCFIAAIAVVAAVACCGCAISPQSDQGINVRQTVVNAQASVDSAQAVVDEIASQLQALPADAPDRKAIERNLLKAREVLARARIYLAIIRAGVDVASPATQPSIQSNP